MLIKTALDEFPEYLLLLKHQQIDAGAVQQISCQFHTRSNSEHQETSSVPLELQVFNHNDFTSSFGIVKVFSSSLKTDLRVLEWIISDIKKRVA